MIEVSVEEGGIHRQGRTNVAGGEGVICAEPQA